jgi:hypothetical protein
MIFLGNEIIIGQSIYFTIHRIFLAVYLIYWSCISEDKDTVDAFFRGFITLLIDEAIADLLFFFVCFNG